MFLLCRTLVDLLIHVFYANASNVRTIIVNVGNYTIEKVGAGKLRVIGHWNILWGLTFIF